MRDYAWMFEHRAREGEIEPARERERERERQTDGQTEGDWADG